MLEEEKVLKEIEKRYKKEKSTNNFSNLVRENLYKIFLLAIILMYITYGLFQIQKNDTSIVEIIGKIGISILMGTTISLCMRNAGTQDARKSSYYLNIMNDYGISRESIVDRIDRLQDFCNMKNTIALENKKRDMIESVMLNYKAWKSGFYDIDKNYAKLKESQKLILRKVQDVKVEHISPIDLMNASSGMTQREYEKYGTFGRNEKQYTTEKTISGLFLTIVMSVVFGYYTLELVGNADILATIVWNLFQIIIWVSGGLIKYYDNRNFILYEYCEKNIVAKMTYLNEFKAILNSNISILDKYSDNINYEIEQFIKEEEGMENGNCENTSVEK